MPNPKMATTTTTTTASPELIPSAAVVGDPEAPTSTENFTVYEPVQESTDGDPFQSKKRRRRMKHFPEMIPSRILRPHAKPSHKALQLSEGSAFSRIRRRRAVDMAKELDIEALIAISVGFPVDSLTEEEIEANVVASIGGVEQANYIVIRNHILAQWRSNVSRFVTVESVLGSIKNEHKLLVDAAYRFLVEHGYINFGFGKGFRNGFGKGGRLGFSGNLDSGVERANVVVIGAGLSGLVAARQLVLLGFKVVLVEGRSRAGGRVKTIRMKGELDGQGVVAAADIGGSVLTGINGNPFGVLARQMGLPLHKVRDICPLYLPDGRSVDSKVDGRVEASFNRLLDKVCKLRGVMLDEVKSVDVSLGKALEAFRKAYEVAERMEERMLLNWHLANLEYANATLMDHLSMAYWDQDDPFEMGGDHCFIPGGNERFVRALAEDLPIFYDRTVESVRYGVDGVVVYAGGQEFRGDMALCTVPLGVLKKGEIEFVPELPQRKKDAIERLGFGLLNKVALLFPYAFWGGEIDTFGHLTEEQRMRGEFFLFYSYSSVSGGPLLIALVAGEAAVKFETMSPSESVNRVLDILRNIYNPKGIDVPDPVQAICTRWGKDRFAYGSYSYVSIGSSGDDYDILAESVGDGRVFFAGEATNKLYPATMHGAFLSGMREAANILRVAKRKSIVQEETLHNAGKENAELNKLFAEPDLRFGNFSILFDPSSDSMEANALLRAEFENSKSSFSQLHLYGLLTKKQAIELSEVAEEEIRMKMINYNIGVKLVGKNSMNNSMASLLSCITSSRLKRTSPVRMT